MQLFYGTLAFPVNAAEVTSRVSVTRSQAGRPMRYVFRIDVLGTIDGSGQADLSTKEDAFRRALLNPYQDLVLKNDDGTRSASKLVNRDSLSGTVLVDGPHFEEAKGYEYATGRTVRFSMTGEYLVTGADRFLVRWQQSITVQGNGGPSRRWRLPLNARPIRQVVTPYTIVRVLQQGMAVGLLARPDPAGYAVDEAFLNNEAASVTRPDPTPVGPGQWVEWPVTWNYVFEVDSVPSIVTNLPGM